MCQFGKHKVKTATCARIFVFVDHPVSCSFVDIQGLEVLAINEVCTNREADGPDVFRLPRHNSAVSCISTCSKI